MKGVGGVVHEDDGAPWIQIPLDSSNHWCRIPQPNPNFPRDETQVHVVFAATVFDTRAMQAAYVQCASCYAFLADGGDVLCGRGGCRRRYCGAACRSTDWHELKHSQWCGRCAEMGHGYDVRDAGTGRGQGVFATRSFAVGDKIMADHSSLGAALNRPVAPAELDALPLGARTALAALSTCADGTAEGGVSAEQHQLQGKYTNNAIGLGDADGTSGLFLAVAKVNHACVCNSEHYFLAEHGLMLLVCTAPIGVGEEVTFNYVGAKSLAERAAQLRHWGIVCDCRACRGHGGGAGLNSTLEQIAKLDARLVAQGSRGRVDKALDTGERLLALYDRCGGSLMSKSRTYFDMYGLVCMDPTRQTLARQYLGQSIELDTRFFGRADLDVSKEKLEMLEAIALPKQAASSDDDDDDDGSDDAGGAGGAGGRDSEEGDEEGCIDDGATSDEADFPRCGPEPTEFAEGSTLGSQSCVGAADLAAAMAADGAAMLNGTLPPDACARARRACVFLRDEAEASHIFSSPISSRGPPCAAECVWLCDAAMRALAPADSRREEGAEAEDGAAHALQAAIDACASGAKLALEAMGYGPEDVLRSGVPMAAVGHESSLVERFHRGHEGAPSFPHRPRDGLDALGSRPSPLLLTSTLVLDDAEEQDSDVVAAESSPGASGGDRETADPRARAIAGDGAAGRRVAMLRTRTTQHGAPPSSPLAHGKRRRDESAGRGAIGAEAGAPCVVQTSMRPAAGDLLLVLPRTQRSVSGGRVSITIWWRVSPAAAAKRLVCAKPLSSTTVAPGPGLAAAAAAPPPPPPPPPLAAPPLIYDGILTPSVRATFCAMPPVRFAVYDRQRGGGPSNAHEVLIETLLAALGDNARFVEYWGRASWQPVPAHSDLDEVPLLAPLATPDGLPPQPRFPTWAHILYLDVARGVAAPTVLWADDDGPEGRQVFVVPAVRSRLLRFEGSWVHAVPKPAAEYLGALETEEEEAAEERAGGVLRHVLLFNSWADCPPEGQASRPTARQEEEGESGGEGGAGVTSGGGLPGAGGPAYSATPFEAWRSVSAVEGGGADAGASGGGGGSSSTAFVARLMGGPRRRGRSERFRCDALAAPREAVNDALHELDVPSSFRVRG